MLENYIVKIHLTNKLKLNALNFMIEAKAMELKIHAEFLAQKL